MVKDILIFPNSPKLRQRAHKVRGLSNAQVREIVTDLIDTARQHNAVGLAAPQIGVMYRIIVIKTGQDYLPLINPEITLTYPGTEVAEEGCLSIPGIEVPIRRATKVKFRSDKVKGDADGTVARAIQHEIDHLDGILIIDKEVAYRSSAVEAADEDQESR